MRIITSFILFLTMFFCANTAACASDVAWQPIRERRDFRIDDKAAIIENALAELHDVYGSDLNIEELEKSKSYVHSIRSEEFEKDIIAVMIEDREQLDPDCYYEVIFVLPVSSVSVGVIWLDDTPIADYLAGIPAKVYGEDGFLHE